ncbi:hypothetical protein GLW08_06785 [Pontibacillus yanchengensis]|uniref:Uncharacterized protein n=2 Tax=Pontibacillus yanchengensis TaxID=462910 RepID=A0ACC7VE24_9BACI|nr:hypothetical protein [Pontibacillus yanchengensis]MYL32461.1 hypothetical protein [Pontibacillus yanchengensis]MYL53042.1 hypothetical protein [Pontibacillus yanchengensis]
MLNKSLRISSSMYDLLLTLGAFYIGISMLLGNGIFATFPPGWNGIMLFNNWASLALFAIIIFGIGNARVSIYGFIKKEKKLFILTLTMGMIFLLSTVTQIILVKELYLATVQFMFFSSIQIVFGFVGLVTKNLTKFEI